MSLMRNYLSDKRELETRFLAFSKMNGSEFNFTAEMYMLDALISHFITEYNETPKWVEVFHDLCDRYYDTMRIKVISKSELIPSSAFKLNLN